MPNRSTVIFAATFLLGTVCLFLHFWQGMLWGALWAYPAYPLFVKVQRRHRTNFRDWGGNVAFGGYDAWF